MDSVCMWERKGVGGEEHTCWGMQLNKCVSVHCECVCSLSVNGDEYNFKNDQWMWMWHFKWWFKQLVLGDTMPFRHLHHDYYYSKPLFLNEVEGRSHNENFLLCLHVNALILSEARGWKMENKISQMGVASPSFQSFGLSYVTAKPAAFEWSLK